uniref:VWFA domain-containing protein n=1 Tax=Chromera velia CCMP2878 TaxID=1169474 RepID=A0A0G4I531_9ALVE|mmetsp:Transcript_56124/g.109867  ORF Transcript_56124/g.109867 Transcript_56124/m.109867 type:complete len:463 (-) Transcript_56124:613-2001(-)|eukprot:Cvel_11073.t1-p1 / transcript=Cvel_11073.t1 / gene=Cvel_11073 / organism=Chromera_velia_CCMP2878 / gene_product=hypothetical protein / transcript_product=hypothetical protein / location=Cvel_scaffold684:17755-19140(+) / protein_length=462 / sequence_SO=supercontig / SO=protein_coding / is_pseudo=false
MIAQSPLVAMSRLAQEFDSVRQQPFSPERTNQCDDIFKRMEALVKTSATCWTEKQLIQSMETGTVGERVMALIAFRHFTGKTAEGFTAVLRQLSLTPNYTQYIARMVVQNLLEREAAAPSSKLSPQLLSTIITEAERQAALPTETHPGGAAESGLRFAFLEKTRVLVSTIRSKLPLATATFGARLFPAPRFRPEIVHLKDTVKLFKEDSNGQKAGSKGMLIHCLIDESGSMTSVRQATIDGFNDFMKDQRRRQADPSAAADGVIALDDCLVGVTKFDSPRVINLLTYTSINEVPPMRQEFYHPHGATNLLDGVGYVIQTVDKALEPKDQEDRPAVLVLIMTDSMENASTFFSRDRIRKMISTRQELCDWRFVFIGANLDSWSQSASYGFAQQDAYSAPQTAGGFRNLFGAVSANVFAQRGFCQQAQNAGQMNYNPRSNDFWQSSDRAREAASGLSSRPPAAP